MRLNTFNKLFRSGLCIKFSFLFSYLLGVSWLYAQSSPTASKKPYPIQYIGFSSFAALSPRYPCTNFLRISNASKYQAMSILLRTFGDDYSCVKRFLDNNKGSPHLLQVHLTNETCRRKKNACTKEELSPSLGVSAYNKALSRGSMRLKRGIESRTRIVKEKIQPLLNSNTKLIVTTGLEDNYNDSAYIQVLSWVKESLPEVSIARSPVSKSCTLLKSATYCELHLPDSNFSNAPCIFNNDGNINSVYDQLQLFNKFSKCSVLFAWEPRSQGRDPNEPIGVFPPRPRDRTFQLPIQTVNNYKQMFYDYQRSKVH